MSLQDSTGNKPQDPDLNLILKPSEPWIETLSWKPRISVYNNILSEADCDHIISKYGPTLKLSGVLDFQGVFLVQSEVEEDPVLMELTKKIAEWTQIHMDFGESFYLWKYKEGDAYPIHKDLIDPSRLGEKR
jgi:prolyl 4-hydroxylase